MRISGLSYRTQPMQPRGLNGYYRNWSAQGAERVGFGF